MTRVRSLPMAATVAALGMLMTPPLAAQVCLGSTEASPGWLAISMGRAAKEAFVSGADAGWQLSRTVAVIADGSFTEYPRPDPQRNRLAIGAAYTFARSDRFGACVTSGMGFERIDDLHVVRVPVGISFGWTTTFDDGLQRLGFRVEPFMVYSRETIAQFYHTSRFVSGRAAVVYRVQQLLVRLEHGQAFDGDAKWHTLVRFGIAFE